MKITAPEKKLKLLLTMQSGKKHHNIKILPVSLYVQHLVVLYPSNHVKFNETLKFLSLNSDLNGVQCTNQ